MLLSPSLAAALGSPFATSPFGVSPFGVSPLGVSPFGISPASRVLSELAILSAAGVVSPAQFASLTPMVINPFRISPLTLAALLSNTLTTNPLPALFPLTWNALVAGAMSPTSLSS